MIDEYPESEINWFVKQLVKQVESERLASNIQDVNKMIIAYGANSKKGNINYQKWRRDQLLAIDRINAEETVFDKLKNSTSKVYTVFDRLKSYSGS